MNLRKAGVRLGALLIVAAAAGANAHAQAMYRCNNGSSTYWSDRPCANTGKLSSMGPAQGGRREAESGSTYIPPVNKAPEHIAYLSATCATLNDAIRTAPARGLKSQAISELHTEYRTKCDEEDEAARKRVSQEKRERRDERQSQVMAQQAEQARVTTNREQCHEMLRILHGRRKQLDTMPPGEKADFQRFEANYNARCKSA